MWVNVSILKNYSQKKNYSPSPNFGKLVFFFLDYQGPHTEYAFNVGHSCFSKGTE